MVCREVRSGQRTSARRASATRNTTSFFTAGSVRKREARGIGRKLDAIGESHVQETPAPGHDETDASVVHEIRHAPGDAMSPQVFSVPHLFGLCLSLRIILLVRTV